MSELRTLTDRELETLLCGARDAQSYASLRADGSLRMLGQLRIVDLEAGTAIQLLGAKVRDFLPKAGTTVTLSLILGDEAITIRTQVLEAPVGHQDPPLVRLAWPSEPLEFHQREEVRVANPTLPALTACVTHQGRSYQGLLLNLTETGMGLGLQMAAAFLPNDRVTVETSLPGGFPFKAVGEVRHYQILEDDELPVRLGLVLLDLPAEVREVLRTLVQARRTSVSQDMRES